MEIHVTWIDHGLLRLGGDLGMSGERVEGIGLVDAAPTLAFGIGT